MANVYQSARAFGLFGVMTDLLERTGMRGLLQSPCPFTVLLAPDEAFEHVADGALDAWIQGHSHDRLIALLSRHLVPGRWTARDMAEVGVVHTHHGDAMAVTPGDRLIIAGARLLQADVRCDNGVLHVIDRVLVAPTR